MLLPTVDLVAGANSVGSNIGLGRATKKVRTRSDLHLDFDDPTVYANGQKLESDVPKASYKSSLLGSNSVSSQDVFREETFSLIEGDAVKGSIEGVPSGRFLNRVTEFIEKRMAKTVVVKLLGENRV